MPSAMCQPALCGHVQQLHARKWVETSSRWQQTRHICRGGDGDVTDEDVDDTIELEIKVEGMTCGGCSSRVADALTGQVNVKAVHVDLESKMASVEVEAPSLIDALNMLPGFVKTIEELGFEAEPHIEYQS